MVAGAEGGCGAVEGKVAEVVKADGQMAVFTPKREGSVCGKGRCEPTDGK